MDSRSSRRKDKLENNDIKLTRTIYYQQKRADRKNHLFIKFIMVSFLIIVIGALAIGSLWRPSPVDNEIKNPQEERIIIER